MLRSSSVSNWCLGSRHVRQSDDKVGMQCLAFTLSAAVMSIQLPDYSLRGRSSCNASHRDDFNGYVIRSNRKDQWAVSFMHMKFPCTRKDRGSHVRPMQAEVRASQDQGTLVPWNGNGTHMFDVSCMNCRRKDSSEPPNGVGIRPIAIFCHRTYGKQTMSSRVLTLKG